MFHLQESRCTELRGPHGSRENDKTITIFTTTDSNERLNKNINTGWWYVRDSPLSALAGRLARPKRTDPRSHAQGTIQWW